MWVVGGGGLYGYFREQGQPVGVQECPEWFNRWCGDYLSLHFFQNRTVRMLEGYWRRRVQHSSVIRYLGFDSLVIYFIITLELITCGHGFQWSSWCNRKLVGWMKLGKISSVIQLKGYTHSENVWLRTFLFTWQHKLNKVLINYSMAIGCSSSTMMKMLKIKIRPQIIRNLFVYLACI